LVLPPLPSQHMQPTADSQAAYNSWWKNQQNTSNKHACQQCGPDSAVVEIELGTVCSDCGFQIEDGNIDFTAEWRTFEDQVYDPRRCGAPEDTLLEGRGLGGTQIIGGNNLARAQRMQSASNVDKLILKHRTDVRELCDKMEIPTRVSDRAIAILAAMRQNGKRSKVHRPQAMAAAAVFLACEAAGNSARTLNQVSAETLISSVPVYFEYLSFILSQDIRSKRPDPYCHRWLVGLLLPERRLTRH